MRLAALALSLAAAVPGIAAADGPVVVELYTSQGCSACPPADALLADLAGRDDVVALGLHVDYWDYIGWADPFARPAHSERQRAYAHRTGQRMVYTPQIVLDGTVAMAGNKRGGVHAALEARLAGPAAGPDLALVREGGGVVVRAGHARLPAGPLDVIEVRYDPARSTHITAGENAGGVHDYANVVTSMRRMQRWRGDAPLSVRLDAAGPVAILLQRPGQGEIVAAAKLD